MSVALPSEPFLTRVRLKNYKSVASCDVTLGRFTLLVGRNAAVSAEVPIAVTVADTVDSTTTPPTITPLTNAQIDTLINEVAAVETAMIDATASLGSAKNRINLQNDFIANLMDAIDRGVGQLVDADMTEESSRLKSLQVQQQLGIQSLSIANANAQNILALFR